DVCSSDLHALPHVVGGGRHLEDAAPGVRVDIDEPRRDDLACGIDAARRRRVDARRDARDGVAANGEIAAVPRAAGAVDDAAVPDDEIVGRRLGLRCDDEQRKQCDGKTVAHGGDYSAERSPERLALLLSAAARSPARLALLLSAAARSPARLALLLSAAARSPAS